MIDEPEQYTLKDKKAIDLWLAGKDEWNKWVEKNPDANVDFSRVDFGEYRDKCDGGDISFEEYIFPKGFISFRDAQFSGTGDVSFRDAQFSGDGEVSFHAAQFSGDGNVSFNNAQFDGGNVSFYNALFSGSNVYFHYTKFSGGYIFFDDALFSGGVVSFYEALFCSDGGVSFNRARFSCNGDVDFDRTQFSSGNVSFDNALFNGGNVSFHDTKFSSGNVSFHDTKFNGNGYTSFNKTLFSGDGNVSFNHAQFNNKGRVSFNHAKFSCNGDVSFMGVVFGQGIISFNEINFANQNINFELTQFNNFVSFSHLHGTELIKSFSFQHATFKKGLVLPNNRFNCVIDLIGTKLEHSVTLHNLECKLEYESRAWNRWLRKAKNKEDSARFRKLKEIAVINKDHDRAIYFHGQEMRTTRWISEGFLNSVVDLFYSSICDYGRNIVRPTIGLVSILLLTIFTLHMFSNNNDKMNFILSVFECFGTYRCLN